MSVLPDPEYFFNNPLVDYNLLYGQGARDIYSEAKVVTLDEPGARNGRNIWFGNFFADMRAWDRLDHFERRGAGGHVVWVGFPSSPISAHMSVFPARTYKKGHRHGPGYLIVIPAGEGYSIMWPEGGEKIIIPVARSESVRAAQSLVSPALQCRRHAGAISCHPSSPRAKRYQRKSRRPGQRPDRVSRRGPDDSQKIRVGAYAQGSRIADAGRGLSKPRL